METLVTLIIFTLAYGLTILSMFPEKYFRKISHINHHLQSPPYLKFRLATPYFLSFLMGYIMASIMLYFIQPLP